MNKTALDQYEEIVTDALKSCSAKLRKSFKTAFIQLMILYMVLPRKIKFTQMGRYSDSPEQRFRQLFEREFDWMQFNLFLMRSVLVKVQEKPLPSTQATFQSRERRLLISASSGQDALLQRNGDWRFSGSALSTLTAGTV